MQVKVQEILQHIKPIYPKDANWEETISYLVNSPTESIIIERLSKALERDGAFRHPIYVGTAVREDDSEYQAVLNGTHRFATAVLKGLEAIEVEYEKSEEEREKEYEETSNIYEPTVTMDLYVKPTKNGIIEDERFDVVFDIFRSFELDENEWVTSDLCSGSKDGGFCFYYEGSDGSEESIAKIKAKITDIINNNDFLKENYLNHTVELLSDEDENDDE